MEIRKIWKSGIPHFRIPRFPDVHISQISRFPKFPTSGITDFLMFRFPDVQICQIYMCFMSSRLLCISFVILAVAPSRAMPGLHSPDKLAARRQRAIEKGFIVPKHVSGSSHILVPHDMTIRMKSIAKSMTYQVKHNGVSHWGCTPDGTHGNSACERFHFR